MPIDILLHKVFQTAQTKFEKAFMQMTEGKEIELLLKEVEIGQAQLESSL